MAKGLRASVNKSNKKVLRNRVFGPVEQARNERLSAKLMELASQPKPERPEMELDEAGEKQKISAEEAMEVDGAPRPGTASSSKKSAGVRKQRRSKSSTTFKQLDKKKARLQAVKKNNSRR